jgi:glycoprotein endo-alpha-1,2-mannosidase
VYDSYQVAAGQWAAVLGPGLPMYAVGLAVERKHLDELRVGRFDGVYTYCASNGFVWGSTTASWAEMGRFCRQHR